MTMSAETPGIELPGVAVYTIRVAADPSTYQTPPLATAEYTPAVVRRQFLDSQGDAISNDEIELITAEPVTCCWFLLCENDAATIEPHPAFEGGVPTCTRCKTKTEGLKA